MPASIGPLGATRLPHSSSDSLASPSFVSFLCKPLHPRSPPCFSFCPSSYRSVFYSIDPFLSLAPWFSDQPPSYPNVSELPENTSSRYPTGKHRTLSEGSVRELHEPAERYLCGEAVLWLPVLQSEPEAWISGLITMKGVTGSVLSREISWNVNPCSSAVA